MTSFPRQFLSVNLRVGILSCAALAACGGGSGSSSQGFCNALGGGGSTQTSSANTGTVSNPAAAFDGNISSFATLSPLINSADGTFRGIAQAGVVASSGTLAGVAITQPVSDQTVTVTVTTYLDDVVQDSATAGSQTGGSQACAACFSRDGLTFFGIPTTAVYDSIEARLQVTGSTSDTQVRELCTAQSP